MRKNRTGPSLDELMRDGRDIDADDDPERLVEGAELAGVVRRALASLPSRYRELIRVSAISTTCPTRKPAPSCALR